MTAAEAQAVYVAADDAYLAHVRNCYTCGNTRLRYRPACPVGDALRDVSLAKRRDWADAVAAERAQS